MPGCIATACPSTTLGIRQDACMQTSTAALLAAKMEETTAALWAASIGASAAILVGTLAFWAVMRQVRRTALTQREQAFWQSRRDTYVKMMLSLQKFERASTECLPACQSGNFSEDHVENVTAAAWAFEEARFVLLLEAPHDPMLAMALKTTNRKLQRVMTGYVAWKEEFETDPSTVNVSRWTDDIQRESRKLAQARNSIFVVMRNDLHREVGADIQHFGIQYRMVRRGRRREPPVPPLPDDD